MKTGLTVKMRCQARALLRALGLVALAGLAFAATAPGCGADEPQVDFERVEPTPTDEPAESLEPGIRMAVAPVLSALPTSDMYEELAGYLGTKLGRSVQLVQGKTYSEINDLIKSGEVAVAIVCTNPFLQGQADFGMELLVAPEVNGETVYYSQLIVNRLSDAASLDDLRGSSFAFSDPLSNTGRLAPLYQLAKIGESPESFFSRTIFTYSHDSSIKAVAEGVVEGAAVDSLVLDYIAAREPALASNVKVIQKWGPFGINPVVVHPQLESGLKAELQRTFLEMDEEPEGRAVLLDLMIDRFVIPDDRVYDSVREMRAYISERKLSP